MIHHLYRPLGLALLLTTMMGCSDEIAEPFQLDHARILAIRLDPAVLPPESTAALDVLFTDSSARPRLATPEQIDVSLPPELDRAELRTVLRRSRDGWRIDSPDTATLLAVRAALGTADNDPVLLPIEIEIRSEDGPLYAQKLVAFGAVATNPAPPQLRVQNGNVDDMARIPLADDVALEVQSAGETISYRWFSSLGEMRRYTQPQATISLDAADRGRSGYLAVVARTSAGGVSWKIVTFEVTD